MTHVVIMAGGRGKRLKPLTNDTPKPMLLVNGKPMLEWLIKRFVDQGFKDFTISVRYLSEQIEKYFGDGTDFGCTIRYLHEDIPLGTAGALSLLPRPDEPFICINADVLTSVNFNDMVRYHNNHAGLATVGAATHRVEIPYGVLKMNNYTLTEIQEKPSYDYPIAAGVYVLSPEALGYLHRGAMDMPDLIERLPKAMVFPISGEWHDIGRPEDLAYVNAR